jgi:5,10-methylenetetrahydrofolate reductase
MPLLALEDPHARSSLLERLSFDGIRLILALRGDATSRGGQPLSGSTSGGPNSSAAARLISASSASRRSG